MKKRCEYEGCTRRSNFNLPSEKQGRFCNRHATDGMININAICKHIGCTIQSFYNLPTEKKGLFCSEHKTPEMINVRKRLCEYEGCFSLPYFNLPDEKRGRFCKTHATDEMNDVLNKKCKWDGCISLPTYNLPNEKIGIFCKKHATQGMVDVKNKKCNYEGCTSQPSFNLPNHKLGKFCKQHATSEMINVIQRSCKSEWCNTQVTKIREYCMLCNFYLFPDQPITRNYKTKEKHVVDHVIEKFPDFTWVADKSIAGGCSRRRPDLLLDLGEQVIIVEVDENQHINYDCSCENKRIMELSKDIGHRPLVFIRFNPDGYIDENGKSITSCFSILKSGICILKKKSMDHWKYRLNTLEENIKYWSINKTNKTVEIIQLFFDQ